MQPSRLLFFLRPHVLTTVVMTARLERPHHLAAKFCAVFLRAVSVLAVSVHSMAVETVVPEYTAMIPDPELPLGGLPLLLGTEHAIIFSVTKGFGM
eukprot:SAG31_NODE_7941_length_1558_cov_3.371487_1_plen_96_part_00